MLGRTLVLLSGEPSLTFSDQIPVTPSFRQSLARAAGDLNTEAISLRAVALAATGLGRADALPRGHDALAALYEIRNWQKIWQVLDSVVLALARASRTEEAALILGHLQVHMPACGMEDILGFRGTATELITAAGGYTAALTQGAQLTADDIVAKALAYA